MLFQQLVTGQYVLASLLEEGGKIVDFDGEGNSEFRIPNSEFRIVTSLTTAYLLLK